MDRGLKSNQFSAEEIDPAVLALRRWQADPAAACQCPRCKAEGVAIIDCSSRPHAEWYMFRCTTCGLDAPLHRPACPS